MSVPGPTVLEAVDVLGGAVIDVGGIAVALGADDPIRAEAVASLFRHAAGADDPAAVSVRFVAAPVAVPTDPPATVTPYLELWADGADVQVLRTREGLTARATADSLVVGGDAPGLAREFRFVALLGLTHVLARHDRHLLHGAAIALEQGAVVVLGATATGKSTLAFAAHTAGLPVLADDAVLLRRIDGAVHARGVPRPIAVAADVATRVDGGRAVPEDPRDRRELPPGTLAAAEHPVVALVSTMGADPRGPGVDALAGADALRAVLRASIALADADVRPALFALAGALARMPTWSLRHGPDPASALADATEQLEVLQGLLRRAP